MQQYYFQEPFALNGDRNPIPVPLQLSGTVSYDQGFGPDYALQLGVNPSALPVPREESNQLYFAITQNIQQYQQYGTPEWITSTDNGGSPFSYSKNARVRYYNGTSWGLYISLVDSNTVTPGTDATKWLNITNPNSNPQNYLSGLILSNNVTLSNTAIDTAPGSCTDSSNALLMTVATAIGKLINTAWASGGTPGTPTGGFPSALTLATGWYRYFLIAKPDGTVNAGFDTVSNAANLLADATGYTLYRQIGWIHYNGSAITKFFQDGSYFLLDVPANDFSGSTSTSASLRTLTAPPDVDCIADIQYSQRSNTGSSGDRYNLVTATRQTDSTPSSTLYNFYWRDPGASVNAVGSRMQVPLDVNSQVRTRSDYGSNIEKIVTVGWYDNRGQ